MWQVMTEPYLFFSSNSLTVRISKLKLIYTLSSGYIKPHFSVCLSVCCSLTEEPSYHLFLSRVVDAKITEGKQGRKWVSFIKPLLNASWVLKSAWNRLGTDLMWQADEKPES